MRKKDDCIPTLLTMIKGEEAIEKEHHQLVCMILLASSVLAACASNTKGGNTASEGGTGPVEISVFTQQEATQDLKTSDFTKLVEDKFNIRFKWEIIPYDAPKRSAKFPWQAAITRIRIF